MARAQLSPLLCDATQTGQLRPWSGLVDHPEVPAADRPASLTGGYRARAGDDAGGLALVIQITVDTL